MLKERAPQWDIKNIKYGVERCAMANLAIQLAATFKDDWFAGLGVWEALQLAAIMLKMYQIHQAGKSASPSAISRGMGRTHMPRTTVHRKLMALKKRGLVEQYGTKFVLSIDGINDPRLLEGFAQRLLIVRAHLTKMLVSTSGGGGHQNGRAALRDQPRKITTVDTIANVFHHRGRKSK
ncbi:MAG TPA: hypothetical protein VGJ20_46755 [Xanthobacteraceae bacterium]|jgi:hypothetical protein